MWRRAQVALFVLGILGALGLRALTGRAEAGPLETAAIQEQRATIAHDIAHLYARLSADARRGMDEDELAPIRTELPSLERAAQRAGSIGDLLGIARRADRLRLETTALEQAQAAENLAVQRAATELTSEYQGRLEALRAVGGTALTEGRNDAAIGAFLKIPAVVLASRALERYGPLIGSGDPKQAALGVAGTQRCSRRIHDALLSGAPSKMIAVSLTDQRLRAFEDGKVVNDTLVTTGRPELPTDIGRMQVTRKSSPWTMQSPWPKGSPYWYPDTVVQMVLWFTNTGEGIHDAAWEPASAYGPGSTTGPYASHGCIHLTLEAEAFLYNWADVGTPVIVYPGDGAPAAEQVARQTVNAQGEPVDSHPSGV